MWNIPTYLWHLASGSARYVCVCVCVNPAVPGNCYNFRQAVGIALLFRGKLTLFVSVRVVRPLLNLSVRRNNRGSLCVHNDHCITFRFPGHFLCVYTNAFISKISEILTDFAKLEEICGIGIFPSHNSIWPKRQSQCNAKSKPFWRPNEQRSSLECRPPFFGTSEENIV